MREWIRRMATATAVAVAAIGAGGVAGAEPLPVPTNFFDGVAYENAHPGESLPGSNDFDCVPSPEHPNPVILLHDLGATRQSNWAVYVPALKNEGYCVFALTYGVDPALTLPGGVQMGGLTTMEPAAEELAGFVDRVRTATGAQQVDLVGHGSGGMVAAYYTAVLGGAEHVGTEVTLSPLLGGIDAGAEVPIEPEDVLFPPWLQYLRGSDFMTDLHAAGTYAPGVRYVNISTRYMQDYLGHPPAGDNVTDIVVQDGCETDYSEQDALGASPRAVALTLGALDPQNPRPVPCGTILPGTGTMID